jgi:hypothetical protein
MQTRNRRRAVALFAVALGLSGQPHPAAALAVADGCEFSRGTTTCTTTTQYTETSNHSVYSGCVAGPTGQPGRRVSTFEDTYLVTRTTTTYQHGHNGKVYDTQTTEQRELQSSRQVSSTCDAL